MNHRRMLVGFAGVAALCVAGPARAAFSPYMAALTVGGGVQDFIFQKARQATSPQGSFGARLTVGTRTPVAIEADYMGSVGAEHDPIGSDPKFAFNSFDTLARLNLTTWRVQPFLDAGVGYINFHSYGRDVAPVAAAQWAHNSNSVEIPMGGGLAGYFGQHGTVDARFAYRLVPDKNINTFSQRPDMWNASVNLGYAF